MSAQNKKYKIALIGYRLGIGGAEKVMANLSIFFDSKGIEVHNIIVLDVVTYSFAGKLFNLGKYKNNSNGIFNKLTRLYVLKKYLKKHQFDYIIDLRFRIKPFQELLIARWVYNTKTVFNVHSFLINNYIPDNKMLAQWIYKNSFKIVCETTTTQKIIEEKHHFLNIKQIFNPINVDEITAKSKETIAIDFPFIMGMGQMETNVKQFDKMIESYANSVLPSNNIHLILLGEGGLKQDFKALATKLQVDDKVHFMGFEDNPFKYLSKAKFFVLSSQNEGFANVLAEALACHTPVVSFDCKAGPSDIIIHRQNGLLVENQNGKALTEAMNLMFTDQELYDFCKQNAFSSMQRFSLDKIGEQWLEMLNIKV